jgi:hypothetical protein
MMMYGAVEVYLHYIEPRHYEEVSGQLHASAALPSRNSQLYPLYTRLGWSQSPSGLYVEENNLLHQPVIVP